MPASQSLSGAELHLTPNSSVDLIFCHLHASVSKTPGDPKILVRIMLFVDVAPSLYKGIHMHPEMRTMSLKNRQTVPIKTALRTFSVSLRCSSVRSVYYYVSIDQSNACKGLNDVGACSATLSSPDLLNCLIV